MKRNQARIKYYPEYYIGASEYPVSGYAIELWDNEENDWVLCLFMQLKDNEYLHYSFVQMIGTVYKKGYDFIWETE